MDLHLHQLFLLCLIHFFITVHELFAFTFVLVFLLIVFAFIAVFLIFDDVLTVFIYIHLLFSAW